MVEQTQKKHSQDLPWNQTYSKDAVAIFSGKCFMLADLMKRDVHPDDMERILDSMFKQSAFALGYQ